MNKKYLAWVKTEYIVLFGLITASLVLNITGIRWGLPNENHFVSYQGDEQAFLNMLRGMNPAQLDFHPGNFRLGGGVPYTLAAGIMLAKIGGWIEVTSSSEYYYDHIEEWARFYLIGRFISVAAVALSVGVMYLILRELYSQKPIWLALFGAALVAVMPGMVINAHFLSYNAPVVFWIGLSFYFLLRVLRTGQWRDYVLAGLAIGIGIAFRYTAGLLIPYLFLAHVLKSSRARWGRAQLLQLGAGYGAMAVGFSLLMPYALLDFFAFIQEAWWAMRYASPLGKPLAERMYNLWLGGFMPLALSWSTYLLAMIGLGWMLFKRGKGKGEILILAWLIPSLLVAMNANTPVVGRILPIVYMLVVPAVGVVGMFWVQHGQIPLLKKVGIGLLTLVLLVSLGSSVKADAFFLTDTVRADASAWILENIPRESTIGLIYDQPYWDSPDILNQLYHHPERTEKLYTLRVYEEEGDNFYQNPSEYLVVSQRQYRAQPNARDLLAQYEVVAEFMPVVDVGRTSLWYFVQTAVEIRIFKWAGSAGRDVLLEEMTKGWY